MTTWAVLGTGPSMTVQVAQSVMGKCKVAAVSDSWRLAPWADILVSSDAAWWDAHPEALSFPRQKYGAMPAFRHIEGVERVAGGGLNSGLLAVMVAVSLGAKKVLLLGIDLHSPGQHWFGRHPLPLKSSTKNRFETFKKQFARYRPDGVEIVNCTSGSALQCYPMQSVEEALDR